MKYGQKYLTSCLRAIVPFAALLYDPSPASAQVSLEGFAVLAGTAVTCTDSLVIGDVGVAPGGAVTRTNCTISGTVNMAAQQAYADFLHAYNDLRTVPPCDFTNEPLDNTSASLTPGVYCFDAAVTQTGTTWTLDGSCTDTWIFRIGTSGTGALTGTNFTVVNPGCEVCADSNVYWWTAQAATLTDSVFLGSILAGADITVTRGSLDGQALAGGTGTTAVPTGAVTLTNTEVSVCGGAPPHPPIKVTGGGQIPVPDPASTGRATFGFNAQPNQSGGGAKGHLNYVNHVTGLHVNGPVDDIVVIATNPDGSPKTVLFSGTCGNLPACSFTVTVEDKGEPGRSDEFGIRVTGGRSEVRSQRVISRGNIQFHR